METRLIVLAATLAVGCSEFSAVSGSGDKVPSSGDASSADANSADAASSPDDAALDGAWDGGCDAGCLPFKDSFERSAEVQGAWTQQLGTSLSLVENSAPYVRSLRATFPANNDTPPLRTALLSKNVGVRSGIYVKFDFFVTKPSSTFGGATSYCDIAHVALGDRRIADVYINSMVTRFVLYGVSETIGSDVGLATAHDAWATAELKLQWSASTKRSRLVASFNGASNSVEQDFAPTLDGTNVRVGLQCRGTSPAVEARIDNVVIDAFP